MMRSDQQRQSSLAWTLLCLLCLLACAAPAQAEELLPLADEQNEYYCPEDYQLDLEGVTQSAVEQQEDEPAFSFLDPHQEYISDYLRSFTTEIDRFLADTEKTEEFSGSFIRLTFDTTWNEAGDIQFDPGLRFRLHLPQTQRKLKLVIESDPDEKRTTKDLETRGIDSTTDTDRTTGVYTGVESEIGKGDKWKVRPSLGIRIRSPLDYYLRLRASRDKYYTNWKLYLNETLYWFDSTGFGADTTMEWDRLLDRDLIFRSTSFVRYTDERDQWDMSQSLNLIHQLSEKRTVTYKIAAFADTEPAVYATSYLINLRYRQNVHKDYMFVEVQPQVQYEKITAFEPQYSLFLRLELFYRG